MSEPGILDPVRIGAARRIHITGASGAGVTTLGRALAQSMNAPHHDTDDFYWQPTLHPYTEIRPVQDRIRLMDELFLPRPEWILSGSVGGWADPIMPLFQAVVWVRTETSVRLARLRRREEAKFGAAAIGPGGAREGAYRDFMAWAAAYDTAPETQRSEAAHRAWLGRLSCPVIDVDGAQSLSEMLRVVLTALDAGGARA